MKFGKVISELRTQKEISQKDFAKILKISPPYLSLVESDKKRPSLDLLELISKEFDIPLYYFLFKSLEPDVDIHKSKRKDYERITPIINNLIEEFFLSDKS